MANISRKTIKQRLKETFKVTITDSGADEIAEILEREAKRISDFAVENAKRNNRGKVTRADISAYVMKNGLDESR